jgi:O-antigen ligase
MKATALKIIWILLWGIMLFVWTDRTLDPVLMPRAFLGSIGLALGLLFISRKSLSITLLSLQSFQPGMMLLLYLSVSLISLSFANNFAEAAADVCRTGFLLLAYLFIQSFRQEEEAFLRSSLSKIWIFSAWILTGAGAIQLAALYNAGQFTHEGLYSVTLTFANRNILAEMLLLGIPWIFSSAIESKKSIFKNLYLLTAMITLAFTMLLLSRAVWLAALAGGFMVLIASRRNQESPFPIKKMALFISFSAIVGIALFATLSSAADLGKLVQQSWWSGIGSGSERLTLWNRTLELIKDYPMGTGPGSWQFRWGDYSVTGTRNELGEVFFTRPHNDWLWVLAETGWMGFLAYVGIFIAAFYQLFNQKNKQYSVIFGLSAYVIIAFFAFPRERMEETWILAVILAFTCPQNEYTQADIRKLQTIFPKMGLIGMALFIAVFSAYRIRGEIFTKIIWEAKMKGDWKTMISASKEAESWAYTSDPSSTPLAWYQGTAWFLRGNPEKACEYFQQANQIHPSHLHILNNLGSCEEIQNNSEEAKKYYLHALRISPTFDEARINLAAVYYNTDNLDSALYYIENCKQDWTDSVWVHYRDAIYHAKYVSENPDYEKE